LDFDSGALLWRIPSSARLFSPSVADGIAYVGGEDGSLRAVAVATGKVLWFRRFAGWIYPPAIVGNRLVVGGKAHRLYGLAVASGDVLWEIPLNQELVYRPVAIGNGNVVVSTFAGEILALSAADGRRRWQVQDTVANLSPVVANKRLYFRTFGGLLKVRSQTDGALRWQMPLQDLLDHPIQVYREWVVAIDDAGRLTILHAETGQQLAQYDTQSRSIGGPGLSDDQIVLFTDGGGTQPRPRPTVVTWATLQLEER
jgi:outer membrane protein assembly factor BamB